MTFEDLRTEHRAQTMGPRIMKRVRGLVGQKLRHRDPQIYARGAYDYRDGLDDVLNDFTIDVLLGEGQLAYCMGASSVNEFDRRVNHQLNRYLARTRQRTIIDNLLTRSVEVLRADDLVDVLGTGNSERFLWSGIGVEGGDGVDVDDSLIRRAAAVAANSVPKIYTNPDDRNPKVYSARSLVTLLRIFLGEIGGEVARRDLHKLFGILLTPWIATLLGLDEAVEERSREVGPDDQTLVDRLAAHIAAEWNAEEVIVFRYKLANLSDTRLAERLGWSRPTAANAKRRLYQSLQADLEDLDVQLRPLVLTRIATLTDGVTLPDSGTQ